MSHDLLSRENSKIMRGIAILSIMLHNLLHNPVFGLSKENEMSYNQNLSDSFLNVLASGDTHIVAELISFLGWVGVPVFVFLTGYGLAQKYPPPSSAIDKRKYLYHNYLKLFFLMLPAVLFFIIGDIEDRELMRIAKKVFALTMLHNFDYPHLKINPSIYWYFSLTFQYYVFFLFFRKYLSGRNLLILSILSMLFLYVLGQSGWDNAMSIYKHCLTGWFPLFALGVWWSDKNLKGWMWNTTIAVEVLLFIGLFALLVLMSLNYMSWVFVPLIALGWFWCATRMLMRSRLLS